MPESMKTIVSIGCTPDRDYAFLLPIVALAWRDVVGHEPRLLLTGTRDEWIERSPISLAALSYHSLRYDFVGHDSGGRADATLSQHVRYCIAADESIPDDQWIMLSDADLLPIRASFYKQHEGVPEHVKMVSLYSNGDHFMGREETLRRHAAKVPIQSFPMCHIAMRAREWREVYDLSSGNVTASTEQALAEIWPWVEACSEPGLAAWCADQWDMTARLCRQPWFPEGALLIPRVAVNGPPNDRLDRSSPGTWRGPFDLSKWTDAHCHKDPASDANWTSLFGVIEDILPDMTVWALDYRDAFVR